MACRDCGGACCTFPFGGHTGKRAQMGQTPPWWGAVTCTTVDGQPGYKLPGSDVCIAAQSIPGAPQTPGVNLPPGATACVLADGSPGFTYPYTPGACFPLQPGGTPIPPAPPVPPPGGTPPLPTPPGVMTEAQCQAREQAAAQAAKAAESEKVFKTAAIASVASVLVGWAASKVL